MVLSSLVKDGSQISPQDLKLIRPAQAMLTQRERSERSTFRVDHLRALLSGVPLSDLVQQAHFLDDGDGTATDVDVLARGAHVGILLQDSDGVAAACEEPG